MLAGTRRPNSVIAALIFVVASEAFAWSAMIFRSLSLTTLRVSWIGMSLADMAASLPTSACLWSWMYLFSLNTIQPLSGVLRRYFAQRSCMRSPFPTSVRGYDPFSGPSVETAIPGGSTGSSSLTWIVVLGFSSAFSFAKIVVAADLLSLRFGAWRYASRMRSLLGIIAARSARAASSAARERFDSFGCFAYNS